LTHRATSRDVFAHGALRAARWVAGRPPRTYSLGEVLAG
jgi:4-hydroxy-tetrahydrodipicolinate reductase